MSVRWRDLAAEDLLGRHVLGRAHEEARLGEILRLAGDVLDEAEVEHLDHVALVGAIGEEDVARLEIAVDDAEPVGLAQRAADLAGDQRHARLVEGALFAERPMEGAPLDVLHRDVVEVLAVLTVVEDGDRVRVRELGRRRRLEEEALVELGVAIALVLGAQHLERAEPPERRLLGLVDLAHPAPGDHRDDLEAAVDEPPDQRIRLTLPAGWRTTARRVRSGGGSAALTAVGHCVVLLALGGGWGRGHRIPRSGKLSPSVLLGVNRDGPRGTAPGTVQPSAERGRSPHPSILSIHLCTTRGVIDARRRRLTASVAARADPPQGSREASEARGEGEGHRGAGAVE